MLLELLFTVHVLGSVCTSMQTLTDVTHGGVSLFQTYLLTHERVVRGVLHAEVKLRDESRAGVRLSVGARHR